jgi:hypothetical protein
VDGLITEFYHSTVVPYSKPSEEVFWVFSVDEDSAYCNV